LNPETLFFCGVRVVQYFVFMQCFVDHLWSFCPCSFAIKLSGLCGFATSDITLQTSPWLQQSNVIDHNRCYAYFRRQN